MLLLGLPVLAILFAVGSQSTAAPAADPPPNVLYPSGESAYPRLIRLAHSGEASGQILASVNSWDLDGGFGVIEESTDGGASFHQVATIRDPASAGGSAAGQGLCCSSLYELPRQVGAMPPGTLLWADSTGISAPVNERRPKQRLWRSLDHGHTWQFLTNIAVSPNHERNWESELSVSADGQLVDFYSDESDKAKHDQKIVQVRSTDGVHWTDYRESVVDDVWEVRPGMPNVLALPDGTYFMTYEVCNNDKVHLCGAYFRTSRDGWDYGDPHDLGTPVRTPDGKYARHTPTVSWTPGPGPNGTILLTSEMLVNADGSISPGNGKSILTNEQLGRGPWSETAAPIAVPDVRNQGCKNFSPSILPAPDGGNVLEATTDRDQQNRCISYFATGPLSRP